MKRGHQLKLLLTPKKSGPGFVFGFEDAEGNPSTALRETARQMLLDAKQQSAQQSISVENQGLRAVLLGSDPSIKADYVALVETGVVSEADFWRERAEDLQRLAMRNQQAASLPSAKLDFRPAAQQDQKLQYKLSDDMIRQTLACEPPTLQQYTELVKTQKLTVQQFWLRYIQARTKATQREAEAAKQSLELHQLPLDSSERFKGPGSDFFNGIATGSIRLSAEAAAAVAHSLKDSGNTFDLVGTAQEVLADSGRSGGSGGGFGTRQGARVYEEAAAYAPATDVFAKQERQHFASRLALTRRRADRLVLEQNQYSSVVLQAAAGSSRQPQEMHQAPDATLPDLVQMKQRAYIPLTGSTAGSAASSAAPGQPPPPPMHGAHLSQQVQDASTVMQCMLQVMQSFSQV